MSDDFGMRLRTLRERKKLSQKELGRRINKSGNIISRYEANVQSPSLNDLLIFCAVFDVSIEYLTYEKSTRKLTVEQEQFLQNAKKTFLQTDKMTDQERAVALISLQKQLFSLL